MHQVVGAAPGLLTALRVTGVGDRNVVGVGALKLGNGVESATHSLRVSAEEQLKRKSRVNCRHDHLRVHRIDTHREGARILLQDAPPVCGCDASSGVPKGILLYRFWREHLVRTPAP